jgi:hypothetical protein
MAACKERSKDPVSHKGVDEIPESEFSFKAQFHQTDIPETDPTKIR